MALTTLHPNAHIKPWLFMVASNRGLDVLRHKRLLFFCEAEARFEEEDVTFLEDFPDTHPTPEEQAELHDLQREIQRAWRRTPSHVPSSRVALLYRPTHVC